MSGLCVAASFDGRAVERAAVHAMVAAAPHRGQHTEEWSDAGVMLIAQHPAEPTTPQGWRLATMGAIVAVCDARIDNRAELQSELARHGYLADAHDADNAEILLAAFRLWGDACANRVIGDFAFAVWDSRRRRLFAARDAMGMRPLYVHGRDRRRLLLASEIKQILAAPGVPCRIFEPAIATTLAGPYTPPSWTAYEQITQLAPGHALVADGGGARTFRFWSPEPGTVITGVDESSAAAMFRSTFTAAVESRLTPSSTAGILLSGGLDSCSLASVAGHLRKQGALGGTDGSSAVRAYSWAFDELPDSDERSVSTHVVKRYGLEGVDVFADEWWPLAEYPAHAPDRDDPYTWVYQALVERTLERCRADGVDLQLVGDRGDELTGDWVYDEVGMARAGHLADAVHDLRWEARRSGLSLPTAVRRRVLRPVLSARWPGADARLRRGAVSRPLAPWIPDAFASRVDLADVIRHMTTPPDFGDAARRIRHQRIFMAQGARIAVLRNRTRARYGMEFADPYADRRLIELVLALPQWLVQRRGRPKQIVRAAMQGIVPNEALDQARKTIPYGLFDRGFRERAADKVGDLLTSSSAAAHGWLDDEAARTVYGRYRRGGDVPWDFWWPLTVEMWLRRWWTDEARS